MAHGGADGFRSLDQPSMWDKLPDGVLIELSRAFRDLADDDDKFVASSFFTGTSIDFLCLNQAIERPCRERLHVPFKITRGYCVEPGIAQQEWIKGNHPDLKHLFRRIGEMSGNTAYCVMKKENVVIPYSHLVTWGFLCQSIAKANNKSSGIPIY